MGMPKRRCLRMGRARRRTSSSKDAEKATLNMDGKYVLVQGWEAMGLRPEELDYLCLIASYSDFGHCHALGPEGEWLKTSTKPGCDNCVFKVCREK